MSYKVLFFVALFFVGLFFLPKVSSQPKTENDSPVEENTAAIQAKGRGFPRVNFEDGKDLRIADGNRNQNGSAGKLLTSADFDSDGTPDLMTADSSGTLKFYRGNPGSIYQNSAQANRRESKDGLTDEAFISGEASRSISVSPDFLEAGDFNADGRQDILAASKNSNVLHFLRATAREISLPSCGLG